MGRVHCNCMLYELENSNVYMAMVYCVKTVQVCSVCGVD